MRYAVFLRGINVGGNKKVPMAELKSCLEKVGFTNVKTVLNSGNVIVDSEEINVKKVKQTIAETLEKTFGWAIETFVYPIKEIQTLIQKNPFQGIKIEGKIHFYVTFFPEKTSSTLKFPFVSEDKTLKILSQEGTMIFWVLHVIKPGHTGDGMKILEKEFGKNSTTRNWNTLVKIAQS